MSSEAIALKSTLSYGKEIASELILVLACTAALTAAQTPTQTPVFRSGVKLVTLDVTVVDGDGKPVAGLTPADFTATINGTAARVQTLDFQQFGLDRIADAPPAVTGAPAGRTAPMPPPSTRSSRGPQTFLLMLDDLSFVPGAGKSLQFAVERMLKQLDVSDLVGMTTTSGLESPVSPTRDRAALFAAIKRLTGRQTDNADPYFISALEVSEIARGLRDALEAVVRRECGGGGLGRPAAVTEQPDGGGSEPQSGCAERVAAHARRLAATAWRQTSDQLDALRFAIEAMSRVPAPRVIVFLSGGISIDATPQVRDAIEQLSGLAARSAVQVYAMFDDPDAIDMRDVTPLRTKARREEATFLLGGLQSAAMAAGGYAFRVIGQPDRFFSRIVSETSAVYRLGIELPAKVVDTSDLRAIVKVRRDGVDVRSTGRALADAASVAPSREDAIKMALEHGSEARAVPLSIATRIRKDAAGGVQIMVDARIPGDVAAPISAAFGLVDAGGKIVLNSRREVTTPQAGHERQILFAMRAEAGDYRLRFVAADAADKIGSTEVPVTARLTRAGPFGLSDVLTVIYGADGTQAFSASDDIASSATQLSATIELYPDGTVSSGATTSVRVVLSPEGSASASSDVTVTPTSANDRWTAVADLTLSGLAPGRYTLRMDVTYNGAVVGTASRVLRKQ